MTYILLGKGMSITRVHFGEIGDQNVCHNEQEKSGFSVALEKDGCGRDTGEQGDKREHENPQVSCFGGQGTPTRPTLQSRKERIHSFWRGACSALEEVAKLHAQTDEKKRGNMYTQSHGPQQSTTVVGPRNHQKL